MPHYVGKRVSYNGKLCTVRYVGSLPGKGDWLGVEWDNPTLGKHDGCYEGSRYFSCQDQSPIAGSFVRASRPADASSSFLDGLKRKYGSANTSQENKDHKAIQISGKTVEEVGFQRIQQQLAALSELRIVILENLCIAGLDNRPWSASVGLPNLQPPIDLHIEELDLGNNLFECWADITLICKDLKHLRSLFLSGNRLWDFTSPSLDEQLSPFKNVKGLALDNTFMGWDQIVQVISKFPSLSNLSLSQNFLHDFTPPIKSAKLTKLDLSYNPSVRSLAQLSPLSYIPSLTDLSLRGNPISTLECPHDLRFPKVESLDLSSTQLASLSLLDALPRVFPALKSLLTKDTPLANLPSAPLHTTARIATLKVLNFSPITAQERQEAELYYQSSVVQELAVAADEAEERRILENHSRWMELCDIYGSPDIPRKLNPREAASGTLAARMTEFTFTIKSTVLQHLQERKAGFGVKDRIRSPTKSEEITKTIEKTKLVPRSASIYRLIGLVERLFSIPRPLSCRLILETDEFDPVGHDDDGWSVDEDENDEGTGPHTKPKGKWIRREEELIEGRKPVGDWVSAATARVRIERK